MPCLVGIERDVAQRAKARVARLHLDRYKTLTRRERQVMGAVALGRLNKQIAFDLDISEVTVKLHRSNVMRKMQLTSVGELIRALGGAAGRGARESRGLTALDRGQVPMAASRRGVGGARGAEPSRSRR